jgi:hypothetical protein
MDRDYQLTQHVELLAYQIDGLKTNPGGVQLEWNASTISETVVRQNVARLKSRSPWAGLQNWTPRQPRTALSRRRDSFDGRVVGDGGAYTIFNQHRACNKILR